MKQTIVAILLAVMAVNAFGIGVPVAQVRKVYSSTPVTTSAWTQLIDATPTTVSTVEVFDSSGKTMALGVGAPGSEVRQFYITPGGNGQVRLLMPYGAALSVIGISGSASTGELIINLFN